MSASPPSTAVSVSATLDYRGTPIPVNSGDLNQLKNRDFQFTLTQPIVLGPIQAFFEWLSEQFGLPDVTGDVRTAIEYLKASTIGIVRSLGKLLEVIWTSPISITTLVINTGTKTYMFGVTMEIGGSPPGFPLFGGLTLDSVGFLVAHQPS